MISIIIPAYNAHDTIEYAITSLISQTIKDKLHIIILNDASEKSYQPIVDKFKNLISIEEITHEKNLGVGFARQTGIGAVKTKYFSFMDADDIFINSFAYQIMLGILEKNLSVAMYSGYFLEEMKDLSTKVKTNTMPWTFSKLYRTEFIKKNNISVPPQNQNEDNLLNMTIRFCLKNNESIYYGKVPFYLWRFKEDSITRKNNHEYFYHTDIMGVLKGMYHILENPNINRDMFLETALNFFAISYFRYKVSRAQRSNELWHLNILGTAKKFYNDILTGVFDVEFTDELINKILTSVHINEFNEYRDINQFKTFLNQLKA